MFRLILCCILLTGCTTPTPTPTPPPAPPPTVAIILPTAEPEPTPTPTAIPTPAPVTAQAVVDMFIEAGFDLSEVHTPEREPGAPLPNSFDEWLRFTLPEVAPRGGQIFTCSTRQNCDALYAYFDALKGLGGPYYYQSAGGTVVAQLNSGLTPDTAAKFQEIVESLD